MTIYWNTVILDKESAGIIKRPNHLMLGIGKGMFIGGTYEGHPSHIDRVLYGCQSHQVNW